VRLVKLRVGPAISGFGATRELPDVAGEVVHAVTPPPIRLDTIELQPAVPRNEGDPT